MTTPIASMTAELVADLSPAAILARNAEDREDIALRREKLAAGAHENIAALRLALQAAEREAERLQAAAEVADAITGSAEDVVNGYAPGDVLIREADDAERLVLAVRVNPFRVVEYLTAAVEVADARPGDADRPAWNFAGSFTGKRP